MLNLDSGFIAQRLPYSNTVSIPTMAYGENEKADQERPSPKIHSSNPVHLVPCDNQLCSLCNPVLAKSALADSRTIGIRNHSFIVHSRCHTKAERQASNLVDSPDSNLIDVVRFDRKLGERPIQRMQYNLRRNRAMPQGSLTRFPRMAPLGARPLIHRPRLLVLIHSHSNGRLQHDRDLVRHRAEAVAGC